MTIIIAFFAGVRAYHLLIALFFLSFTCMCFGWVTEALSRPDAESRVLHVQDDRIEYGFDPRAASRHTRWEIHAYNSDLLVAGCLPLPVHLLAALQRLGPHLLGWVPYIALWAIVWDNFAYSTKRPENRPPDFVYAIIWGEIFVFSSFAITQILQQGSDWGCRNYWLGECLCATDTILPSVISYLMSSPTPPPLRS